MDEFHVCAPKGKQNNKKASSTSQYGADVGSGAKLFK